MDLLMITKNLDILKEDSAIHIDMLEYESVVDHLYIVLLNSGIHRLPSKRLSKKTWLFATNGFHPWLTPFDCSDLVRREIFFKRRLLADLILAYDPYESGLAALLLRREHKKPYHLHIEKEVMRSTGRRKFAVGDYFQAIVAFTALSFASAVRATSRKAFASIQEINARVGARTVLLPRLIEANVLESEELRFDLHEEYPEYKFIMLTTVQDRDTAALDLVLNALKAARHLIPQTILIVVSDWSLRTRHHVYKRARAIGVQDHVFFETKTDQITSYFKTADVYLMTEPEDPGSYIEKATGCGCPVICPPVGKARDIIVDGDSGFLCDLNDQSCFIKHTFDIIHNPGIRARIRVNTASFLQSVTDASRTDYVQKIYAGWEQTLNEARLASITR